MRTDKYFLLSTSVFDRHLRPALIDGRGHKIQGKWSSKLDLYWNRVNLCPRVLVPVLADDLRAVVLRPSNETECVAVTV